MKIPSFLTVLASLPRMFLLPALAYAAAFGSEVAGEWSVPADGVRGRLVAVTSVDAGGSTGVKLYVELQNLDNDLPKKLTFNRDSSVAWTMSDSSGKPMPAWKGRQPWVFASYLSMDQTTTFWGDSTLRFPVCSATYFRVDQPSALFLAQGLIGTPPWQIVGGRSAKCFIGATFVGLQKDDPRSRFVWAGSLALPAVAMPVDPVPVLLQARTDLQLR